MDLQFVAIVGALIFNGTTLGGVWYKLGKIEQKVNDHIEQGG